MKTGIVKLTLLLACALCLTSTAFGQGASPTPTPEPQSSKAKGLDTFLNSRIRENIEARVDQTDPTKQTSPPAAAGNSTSLVDRSSAPDLLGFGLDFLNLSDKTADKKSATPKTLTFSAYALKSMFSGQDPLDPEIYRKNLKWRSVSFTVGYDVPENTNARDPVLGIKWLFINGRDVSTSRNQTQIQAVRDKLKTAGMDYSALRGEVRKYIFDSLAKRNALPTGVTTLSEFNRAVVDKPDTEISVFPNIFASLTDDERNEIDQKIISKLKSFADLDDTTKRAVQKIRSQSQLALAFTTIQRRSGRPDEYSGVLTYDKGMGNNSITFNGSFILTKTPRGKDSKGGQFAAAIHIPLQAPKVLGYTDPLLLSIEANGKSMTGATPMYVAQAKLTIPITFLPGMEIPISVSVANRTEFVKEKDVKGKFGFTFDVSKAWKAFRDSFMPRE
jgi:hypothetical protein